MSKTSERYLISHLTSTIKNLADTDKIINEKMKALTETNARLTLNGGKQKQYSGKSTKGKNYKYKLEPTGNVWNHGFKVVRGHTRLTCGKGNDIYKGKKQN